MCVQFLHVCAVGKEVVYFRMCAVIVAERVHTIVGACLCVHSTVSARVCVCVSWQDSVERWDSPLGLCWSILDQRRWLSRLESFRAPGTSDSLTA